MKRLIKKSTHDMPNRSKACVFLNGEVREGFVHSQIISTFDVPDDNYEIAFGHIVTSDKMIKMKQELISHGISDNNVLNQIFQNWKDGETRVFISTGRELTADLHIAAEAFKNQLSYDNITVWNDDNYNVEWIGLNIFVNDEDELYDLELDDLDAFKLSKIDMSTIMVDNKYEVISQVFCYEQIL